MREKSSEKRKKFKKHFFYTRISLALAQYNNGLYLLADKNVAVIRKKKVYIYLRILYLLYVYAGINVKLQKHSLTCFNYRCDYIFLQSFGRNIIL